MTDEEKAEFINEMTEKIYCWLANEKAKIKQAIKEGLEKGLAEGRISTIEQYSQVDRATISSVETLEKKNAELKEYAKFLQDTYCGIDRELADINKEKCELLGIIQGKDKVIAELKAQIESYRNAVEKCRHIPYIGVGDEVCHTVVEYAQKVDGILFSVEGVDYWFKRLDK